MRFRVDFNDFGESGLITASADDAVGVFSDLALSTGTQVELVDDGGYQCLASVVRVRAELPNPLVDLQIDWPTWHVSARTRPLRLEIPALQPAWVFVTP